MKITFTKDFATKKKGDHFECHPMLASRLIHFNKVAKPYTKPKPKK